ncbi:MAG: hypothetical protein H2174_00070 [Vampirovibrio sp.]|nr:hypothetical protein [Vampirovibrio sp.]
MWFRFFSKLSWLGYFKVILLASFMAITSFAQAEPLTATVLDDLFLLDAPPSVDVMRQIPTPNEGYPKRQQITKTTISPRGTQAVAYLSTLANHSMPLTETALSTQSLTPSLRSSTSISTQELLIIARSPELVLALQRMSFTPQSRVSLDALRQRGGKVMFKNLAELGSQYSTFDALAWLSKDPTTQGAWVLFIAEKHRKAPVEALASLITHEALHADFQNSYCEEEHAWLAEVTAWQQFKAQNPTLQHIPKGWYGLVDRLNAIETALAQQALKAMIRNNPGYAGLQEASPYFRYSPFEVPATTVVDSMALRQSKSVAEVKMVQSAMGQPLKPINAFREKPTLEKPFPLAVNGRPKLTLRPLRTW